MGLKPFTLGTTEKSVLDDINFSDATSGLSFSNYKVSFDTEELEKPVEQATKKTDQPKKPAIKTPPKFKGSASTNMNSFQISKLREYLLEVKAYSTTALFREIANCYHSAVSGHSVRVQHINKLLEDFYKTVK